MTLLLALSSLLSRLIGVYRNHELANLFGASGVSDAYFAAFQIPDTLYRLFVFGAISASFVPLFLSLKKNDEQEAWTFVSSVMNGFLLFVLGLALVMFFFAGSLVGVLYPEFTPELQALTSHLLRIMMVSPILFTLSSVFSGIENAFRSFWGFALAPIVYNLGILFGIFVLAPQMGIYGVAYGVVIGAFFHAFVQLIPSLRLGLQWKPVFVWSDAFKKMFTLSIPRVLSMAGTQINFFIEGVIATTLALGNLTVLRYAQDIQSFPIGIIGLSMAISSFSIISHFVIDEKISELAQYLKDKLDHLLFLMIPAAFGLWVLRVPIIELVLGGGDFGQEAILLTANTLSYLCIGLVASALIPMLSRIFFAFHDTFWPFVITIASVVVNTGLALYFSKTLGIAGVGLASAVSSTLSMVAFLILLKWKYFQKLSFISWSHLLIFIISSAVMTSLVDQVLSRFDLSQFTLGLFLQIMVLTILGMAVYGISTFLFLRKKWLGMVSTLGK
ncbi:MAG: murein biosynthesis integral membrane protein MurJ [Candidatus Altimarinota bacterium]